MTAKAALSPSRAAGRPMPLTSPPSARTLPTWINKCRPRRRGRRPTSTFAPTQGTAATPPPPSAALIPLKVLLPSAARPRCLPPLPQRLPSLKLQRPDDARRIRPRRLPSPLRDPSPLAPLRLPPSLLLLSNISHRNVNAGRPLPRSPARSAEIVVTAELNRMVPSLDAPSTTPTPLPQLSVVALTYCHRNPLATCVPFHKTHAQCILIPLPTSRLRPPLRTIARPTTDTELLSSSQLRHVDARR